MKTHVSILMLLALFVTATAKGDTSGSVTFTVTTKAVKARYSPRHVMAIWVTNSKGEFVKTLAIHAKSQKKRLTTWIKQSKKNAVDAVTGATLKTHQTHTVTWDCLDVKGKSVPDGDYQIHVEFTSANSQGPVTPALHIQFHKGLKAVSMTPKPLPYFVEMKLIYTPQKVK